MQCYWQKPSLSSARQAMVTCSEIFKTTATVQRGPRDATVLEKFRCEAALHGGCSKALISVYGNEEQKEKLTRHCLFDIMVDFINEENDHSYENFKNYSNNRVDKITISNETKSQASSKLWHCMRQGRITGSKIYEIAHCQTADGSLVEEILGGYKVQETEAMKRGKYLEKKVLTKLEERLGKKINEAGFYLINGISGASPDGIGDDFLVEIKCPVTEKTKKNYFNNKGVSNKCMAQIQMEMLAAEKRKCILCIADPEFEKNSRIETHIVNYDENYIQKIMDEAELFWKANIFPKIYKSALS